MQPFPNPSRFTFSFKRYSEALVEFERVAQSRNPCERESTGHAGEFTKSDIANYIFQNVSKFFSEADVKNLRAAHFDEKRMLGSILRTDADLPEELRKAIRTHYEVDDKEKKKSSKKSESLSTVA